MSVVAAHKFDDLISSGKTSCRTDSAHDCLCSGVYHTDHLDCRHSLTDEFRHLHFDLGRRSETQPAVTGAHYRFQNLLVVMSQDHRTPGTDIIHIPVAVRIKHIRSRRSLDKPWAHIYISISADRRIDSARDVFDCFFV